MCPDNDKISRKIKFNQAADNLEKLQKVIKPYIKKPMVETPQDTNKWVSTDKHITSIDYPLK